MNSNKYFTPGMTVAQIKSAYHKLALANHPDRGGDTATMQEINAAYQRALQSVDGSVSYDENNEPHEYHYNAKRESEVVEFIDQLCKSGVLSAEVESMLIGTWVWMTGDTKPVKEMLKGLGMKWHSKRIAWYWHPAGYRSFYNKNASLESLAAHYGASRLANKAKEDAERIAA